MKKHIDFDLGRPIGNRDTVSSVEKQLGVRLPTAFIAIVMKHDGAHLSPSEIHFTNPETGNPEVIGCNGFYPLEHGFEEKNNIVMMNEFMRQFIPGKIVLFGVEGGGYQFAFDYRDYDGDNPPIVIIMPENSPENKFVRVADNFEDFLSKLK